MMFMYWTKDHFNFSNMEWCKVILSIVFLDNEEEVENADNPIDSVLEETNNVDDEIEQKTPQGSFNSML